ncbi:hypothetical protein GHT06_012862 [Daphnia sinensis]|uniref:Uncharacterized protein n=1 Tax=Daphnia sinensis TaxID=1820382 RepID=A0AAD5Q053_9CRUS|nr:hypothetical protein GHT06_012862 [Daphnia sinensis]
MLDWMLKLTTSYLKGIVDPIMQKSGMILHVLQLGPVSANFFVKKLPFFGLCLQMHLEMWFSQTHECLLEDRMVSYTGYSRNLSSQRRDGGESKVSVIFLYKKCPLVEHSSLLLSSFSAFCYGPRVCFLLIRSCIRTLAEDNALYPNEIPHITSLKLNISL